MKKEEVLAEGILEHVGGKENLRQLAHCMTRVRLALNNPTKADIQALKQLDGVIGVIDDETLANRRRTGDRQPGRRSLEPENGACHRGRVGR